MICENNYKDKIITYECNYKNKIDVKMYTQKHYIFIDF